MKGKFPNGLASVLKARSVKAADLARSSGQNPQQVSRLVHGERKLTREWAEKLAPHLPDTSPAQLIFASDSKTVARTVPLGDLISAGRFLEMPVRFKEDDDELPEVIEALPEGDWIAFDVIGDSMNLLAPDGSRIFVDRTEQDLENGQLYVVALDDGATFKRFRSPPARLEPESSNPAHQTFFFQDAREARVVGRVRKVVRSFF